jgi:hypothetical protein
VLAESAEADHVIELINQAKIFRYVLSPYKPQKIKFFIDSALTQFQRHTSKPVLMRAQKVDTPQGLPARSTSSIVERLRSLRSLFGPRPATR